MIPTKPDVVFISSLGHSGSTVLERALSTHPDLVGLGEVHQLLRTFEERPGIDRHPCGCGVGLRRCPLWSHVLPRLREAERDPVARYRIVLDVVCERLGPDVIPVDSSKSARALGDLLAAGPRVHAVDLVRDVRSWTVSRRDRAARRARRHGTEPLWSRTRLRTTSVASFWTWQQMNEERKAHLASTGIPAVTMGYEPFTADPGATLARVLVELGLDPAGASADGTLDGATTHTVFGNNMKRSPHRAARVIDDQTWTARSDWRIAARLLPGAMRRNTEWVYGTGSRAD